MSERELGGEKREQEVSGSDTKGEIDGLRDNSEAHLDMMLQSRTRRKTKKAKSQQRKQVINT